MLFIMFKFIFCLGFFIFSLVFVCIVSENFDIYFLRDSLYILNVEIVCIVKWIID